MGISRLKPLDNSRLWDYNTNKKKRKQQKRNTAMSNTYKEIKRLTGNNIGYAAAALARTIEENDWITGAESDNIVYLRNSNNDWVAIPDYYCDEDSEFNTVRGVSVKLVLGQDTWKVTAVVAE
jgi:hypothetical protein